MPNTVQRNLHQYHRQWQWSRHLHTRNSSDDETSPGGMGRTFTQVCICLGCWRRQSRATYCVTFIIHRAASATAARGYLSLPVLAIWCTHKSDTSLARPIMTKISTLVPLMEVEICGRQTCVNIHQIASTGTLTSNTAKTTTIEILLQQHAAAAEELPSTSSTMTTLSISTFTQICKQQIPTAAAHNQHRVEFKDWNKTDFRILLRYEMFFWSCRCALRCSPRVRFYFI